MQTKLCESAFFSCPPGNHKKAIRTKPILHTPFFFQWNQETDLTHTLQIMYKDCQRHRWGQKQLKRSWKEEGTEAEGIVRTTSIDAPSSVRASICLCILEGGWEGQAWQGAPGARVPWSLRMHSGEAALSVRSAAGIHPWVWELPQTARHPWAFLRTFIKAEIQPNELGK